MSKKRKKQQKENEILFRQMTGACIIFTLFVVSLIGFIVVVRG